jgi:hypothetical protein
MDLDLTPTQKEVLRLARQQQLALRAARKADPVYMTEKAQRKADRIAKQAIRNARKADPVYQAAKAERKAKRLAAEARAAARAKIKAASLEIVQVVE